MGNGVLGLIRPRLGWVPPSLHRVVLGPAIFYFLGVGVGKGPLPTLFCKRVLFRAVAVPCV